MLLKTITKIETRALTIPELSDDAKDRLEIVWQLSQDGMTPTEISNLFKRFKSKLKKNTEYIWCKLRYVCYL